MKKVRILAIILLAAAFMQIPALAENPSFSDVRGGEWYDEYLDYIGWLEQLEIINGYGDGSFRPDNTVTKAEFLKMIAISSELYTITPDKGVHWAESYWNMLNEAGVLEGTDIACTKAALNSPITRYEMAMLITNALYAVNGENMVKLSDPESNIADYSKLNMVYRSSVEQAYGKGILTGYEDSSFRGDETLTRIQATAVLVRFLWSAERREVSFAEEQKTDIDALDFVPFAIQYRSMTVDQRRVALFGNANKTYFTGASDASGYMETITVPIWTLQNGVKSSSSMSLTVHKLVAKEVGLIFREIYNDPERFPINSIGGSRYSDTMRHSWGCAIDINPVENYYLSYSTGYQVGSHWRPYEDPYSITPDGSVVRAFAKYGWGWGGQGWASGVDYMHFSILSSGG